MGHVADLLLGPHSLVSLLLHVHEGARHSTEFIDARRMRDLFVNVPPCNVVDRARKVAQWANELQAQSG